ncbi:hypothetical protein [Thermodesulfovibrio thiophilus]|uniref:hypothetical protein n=1 Tax=Thermodesulfovibrio thiophilus TaxID=340095 RepID=UPI000491AD61|nr:hypothetical protein [Thermodesulfovibrio thiophilus]
MFTKSSLIIAVCFITVLFIGSTVAQNNNSGFQNNNDAKGVQEKSHLEIAQALKQSSNEQLFAAKPCTPSGWWCTSNSQCCSGSCKNNVCN